MDFFKSRYRIAFWSAIILATIEIARQYALGDYREEGIIWADFAAILVCNWLIWRFNFFVDDYQQRLSSGSSRRLFLFRAALIFTVGTAIVLGVESIVHYNFRQSDNIWFYFLRGMFHNAIILVIYYAMQLQRRSRNIALENARLKEENVNAQLNLLRQQVNPHFLFNALNTLKSMVKTNDAEAPEFIVHLSEVYRYLLQSNPRQQVTVREELEMLQSYSFLLKTRFGDNFNLKIDLPENLLATGVPPLTFQLLLENAIKHNVVSMDRPLAIEIFSPDPQQIAVRNNLQPKKSVENGTGTGLENIQHRYQLLAGKGVEVEKTEEWFTVFLPLIN
ncbi:MAG: histidine kinase [Saprospiraceae bacterium]